MQVEAILFDMDGVLVDVSNSYRKAIKKTAEYFLGQEILPDEIQAYKNKGHYNNDWDLTEAIISARGKNVKKEDIIDRFQKYYLGHHFDGLIQNETWLLALNVLMRLRSNFKLGIVTGRPRAEAEYVLSRFNLTRYFDILVALEDVPIGKTKPDPYSVQLALQQLQVQSALYLGDTIDDMIAAKSAGVTPVGILTRESANSEQKILLKQYGAVEVLEHVNEILELSG